MKRFRWDTSSLHIDTCGVRVGCVKLINATHRTIQKPTTKIKAQCRAENNWTNLHSHCECVEMWTEKRQKKIIYQVKRIFVKRVRQTTHFCVEKRNETDESEWKSELPHETSKQAVGKWCYLWKMKRSVNADETSETI